METCKVIAEFISLDRVRSCLNFIVTSGLQNIEHLILIANDLIKLTVRNILTNNFPYFAIKLYQLVLDIVMS